jgi:hypothetical protein
MYDPPSDPPSEGCGKKMKIECVITCVGYGDILVHTLPMNQRHFDKIIVVTSPEDARTKKVCDYWGVKYHATDIFQSRWGQFFKGRGINEGLEKLDKDEWICQMDADIALPPSARFALEQMNLNPLFLYGVDRVECRTYLDWARFLDDPEPLVAGNGFFINTTHSGFQWATRVKFDHHGGYVPIGFFQLWNAASKITKYQEGHSDAGREDSHFAIQWPRDKRQLLPEIIAYHLESENAEMALNWKGRRTKPFSINTAIEDAIETYKRFQGHK